MKHPRSLLRRAAGAVAAFVVASAALVNAGNSPARADQNTDIKFGPVTLTRVTDTGEAIPAPERQLHKGDWFHLNVDFDATRANPKPGQSFAIDLPEPFVNRDGGNSRGDVIKPLEYTDSQGATVKAGECKVDRSRITCTFSGAIEGKLDVSGKIQAQLLALGAIDKTSSVLTINGKEYTVAHPWNEDITLRPAVQFKPSIRLAKSARGVGTNSTWINWHVLLGGSWLKANHPNGGPVTATDVIQDGLEVPDPATIKLVEVQAGPDGTGETERVVATANPAATDLVWGAPKFSSEDNRVAIGGDDTSATFTVVDQITLPVLLTNTATRTTGGVATPPAASPTPDPKDPRPPGRWSPQIPELTTPSIPPNLRRRRPSPSRHRPHRPPGPCRHPSSPDCPGPATTAASGRTRKVRGRVNPAPEPTRGGLPVPPLSRAGLFARDRPRAPKRCRRTRVVLCRDETVRLSRGLPKTVVKSYGQPCDVHRFREPLQALRR